MANKLDTDTGVEPIDAPRERQLWLKGQQRAFQAAMNGASLKDSLQPLVDTVTAHTNGDARAAFYTIPAGKTGLHLIAGMNEVYGKCIEDFNIGPDSFACGLAMHIGEPVITPDVTKEPRWHNLLSVAIEHKFRACWSFPIRTDGGPVLGTFAFYFENPRLPDALELQMANVLGHAAAIIISRYNELKERALSEQTLRDSEEKYRALFDSMDEGYCILQMLYDDAGKAIDFKYLEVNRAFAYNNGLFNAEGKTIRELAPDIEHKWIDIYNKVAETGIPVRFEEDSDALKRVFSLYAFKIGRDDERKVAVIFTDVTERKRYEGRQKLLLNLSDALRPLADPVEMQQVVTQLALKHFNADRCYYCEIIDDEAVIRRDAAADDLPSVVGKYPISAMPIFTEVVGLGKPFVVEDAYSSLLLDPNLKGMCIALQVISFIDVPVIKDGRAVGILCITQTTPRKWKQYEIELAIEIADRTWAGVDRAQTEAALHQAELEKQIKELEAGQQRKMLGISLDSIEEERHRIAESLHNGLGQVLYATKISLAGLNKNMSATDFEQTKKYTSKLLDEAITESRRISHELMPATLEEFGLKTAIEDMCMQMQDGVKFRCKITGLRKRLEKYLELAIYRTMQELMMNVVKHAHATDAQVIIKISSSEAMIRVKDNGCGIDSSSTLRPGIGLVSIQNKTNLLNGRVNIMSEPGQGTCVEVIIPIQQTEKQ